MTDVSGNGRARRFVLRSLDNIKCPTCGVYLNDHTVADLRKCLRNADVAEREREFVAEQMEDYHTATRPDVEHAGTTFRIMNGEYDDV